MNNEGMGLGGQKHKFYTLVCPDKFEEKFGKEEQG